MTRNKKTFNIIVCLISIAVHTIAIPAYAHDEKKNTTEQANLKKQTEENSSSESQENEPQEEQQLSQEEAEELEKAHKAIVDEFLKKGIEQLESIDFVLEHIAGRLNNKSITVKNPQALRKSIKDLRSIINTMRSNAYVHTSHNNLVMIIHLNTNLIEQINKGFSQKLQSIPQVDVMQLLTRAQQQNDLQQLAFIWQNNDALIADLQNKSENFGLNRFNRAYRNFEQLNKQHHLIGKTVKTVSILGTLGYVLYKLPDSLFDPSKGSESVLEKLQKAASGQLSKEQKRKSLLSFRRIPRPAELPTGPLFGGKLGWMAKELYSIKKGLGTAPIIEGGMIKKAGTGLYGKFDTYKASLQLSAQHLGLGALAPAIYAAFEKDIKKAALLANASWQWAHAKLRGGKQVKAGESITKKPKTSLTDVIGNDHIKQIFEPVIEYVCNPKKFDQPGIPPEKGYLMAGNSRTGKTYFAEALAGEINKRLAQEGKRQISFIPMPASEISNYGGIDKILDWAKSIAPCVLFIDEIDLVGRGLQRDRDPEALSKFLTSMSGCLDKDNEKQVIILAATNRPEHLDFALRQPGRFGEIIRFEYPPLKSRQEFLKREFDKRCLNVEMFDIEQLAYETQDCSFDGIKSIIVSAMQQAKLHHTIVTQEDFTAAIDAKVRHIIPTRKQLPHSEQRSIALYQASHALAMHLLSPERVIVKITTHPITADIKEESIYQKNQRAQQEILYGDVFSFLKEDALNLAQEKSKIAQIKVLVAGHVGAELMNARAHNYRMHDNQQAIKLAQELMLGGFVTKGDLSRAKQDEILDKAWDLVQECKKDVYTLLEKNRSTLSMISQALIEKGSISGDELKSIIEKTKSQQNKKN